MGGHGHDAHGHGHAHGHAHVDTSGDKAAAFVGMLGGLVVLGAMTYGMVLWTNSRFAGHEGGEKPAAAAEASR